MYSQARRPLYFFYDSETTGLSVWTERIIEIAAKVVNHEGDTTEAPTFTSLIHTSHPIEIGGEYIDTSLGDTSKSW